MDSVPDAVVDAVGHFLPPRDPEFSSRWRKQTVSGSVYLSSVDMVLVKEVTHKGSP